MSFPFSEQMLERPQQTLQAMQILERKTSAIARLCAGAQEDEIVIVVVNPDLLFGGAWAIPQAQLHERASLLPPGGWSLTFAPQTTPEQIQQRCRDVIELARQRWEMLKRHAHHSDRSNG